MYAWVKPGDEFRIECVDWTGGQIFDDNSANDVRDVNLTKVHYLSGPVGVKGAEPGDLLVVDLLDVGVLPESNWGFTGIFAKQNGGGFLDEHFPDARKACWHFSGLYANSRHIPGVEFAGITHPGLIGCLPSRELLDLWNKRESSPVRHRSGPGAALVRAAICRNRAHGHDETRRRQKSGDGSRAHGASARTWRQLRH
jgi:formamidase